MKSPSISEIPASLDALIDWRWPEALMVGYTPYSEEAGEVFILDLDYRYTKWLASLSLDQRWTLSPVAGPFVASGVHQLDL